MAKVSKSTRYDLLRNFGDLTYTNTYTSRNALILWMQMTTAAPTDRSGRPDTTLSYSTPDFVTTEYAPFDPSSESKACPFYWQAGFSDSTNTDAVAANTSGLFSFTSVGDGGTPHSTSDRPFSFSVWAKMDAAGVINSILGKESYGGGIYGYWMYINGSDQIQFRIYDPVNTGYAAVTCTLASEGLAHVVTQWTHYVFTYDGRGSDSVDPQDGLKIYVNGHITTTTVGSDWGTYVGMGRDDAEPLQFAAYPNGAPETNCQMAEVAAWSVELSSKEVMAIYNATLQGGAYPRSGIISNPPRVRLNIQDCATGSYPTVSRMGDTTRLGRYATSFDDRNTIVFATSTGSAGPLPDGVTLSLPLGIQTESGPVGRAYMSQSVATPNTNSTLEAFGTVRKGVADANIHLTPGEDFAPFKEDGLYVISKDARVDPFYTTGSRIQDVGPGFSQPLGAKTKIVFDLTANVSSAFGFYPSSGNPRPHLMSYFDHDLRKWVPTGEGFFNSASPPEADIRSMLENNCLGFGPTQDSIVAEKGFLAAMGLPVSTYGFPSSARYHATSSCAWPLSGVLDRPFVAEKFVYEFSASYECRNHGFTDMFYWDANENAGNGGLVSIGSNDGPSISSFFILNQRGPFKGSVTLSAEYTTAEDPNTITEQYSYTETLPTVTGGIYNPSTGLNDGGTYVDTTRDLVTYGQIHVYPQTVTWPTLDDVAPSDTATVRSFKEYFEGVGGYSPEGQRHGRELNVGTLPTYNNVNPMFEGRFIMSGTMKVCGRNEGGYPLRSNVGVSGRLQRMNWESNGRNLFTMNTGRDLARAAPGQGPAHPGYHVMADVLSTEAFGPPVKTTQVVNSPYLLKPSDSLIFGWQVPPSWNYYNPDPGPSNKKEHWIELAPSPSRLTIYGSEIADNREHHPGLNQHLTSDAVHELVGFHGPPLDQFDTELRSQYSGSILSRYVGIQKEVVSASLGGGDSRVYIVSASLTSRVLGDASSMVWTGGPMSPYFTGSAGQPKFDIATGDGIYPDRVADLRLRPNSQFRSVMCQSSDTFYDCYVPSPIEMEVAIGKYPFTGNFMGTPTPPGWYQLVLNIYDANYGNRMDTGWWGRFPFEPDFLGLKRRVADPLPPWNGRKFMVMAWPLVKGTSKHASESRRHIDTIWPNNIRVNGMIPGGTLAIGQPLTKTTSRAGKRALLGMIFGIGDAQRGHVQGRRIGDGKGHGDESNDSNGPIRGFKYGIYNVREEGAITHFRGTSFGQFRDMLEQGLDTRTLRRRAGRISRSSPTVRIRFVNASDGSILSKRNRYLTVCSNLSPYATSSLPYFDGDVRNRGPIPELELGTEIVSI